LTSISPQRLSTTKGFSKRFLDTLNLDGDKAFNLPFDKMTSLHGKEFMDYLRCSWAGSGGCMSVQEFCGYNNISLAFFNKYILYNNKII